MLITNYQTIFKTDFNPKADVEEWKQTDLTFDQILEMNSFSDLDPWSLVNPSSYSYLGGNIIGESQIVEFSILQ